MAHPVTGKTHTIRYLASSLVGTTTLIITAEQVGLLAQYMALARLLQPAMVVIEDVDLIARSRDEMQGGGCDEVLLNRLLNEMDGLQDNADILFVLTTNRPHALEAAIAQRPGRVDQAIEVPLPDRACREKLVRLYGRGMVLGNALVVEAAQRTDGVSAAFIKELMRRTAQSLIGRKAKEPNQADLAHRAGRDAVQRRETECDVAGWSARIDATGTRMIPVPDSEQLEELAERWSVALARLHAAEQAIKADKARRQSDVVARVVDAVTETPVEAALEAARAAAKGAQDIAVPQIMAWLNQRESELLEADGSSSPWAVRQALRYRRMKALVPRLRHWHTLAMEAIAVMERDAATCRSIGSVELVESVARWPIPAITSVAPPGAAMASTIQVAKALETLRAALPEEELSIDLEGLNELLRRLWAFLQELVIHRGIEFTNNKHIAAGEKLEMAARMLTPLAIHLQQFADRAAAEVAAEWDQVEAFLDRYRIAARSELPKTLQALLATFENKDGIKLTVSAESR